MARPKIIDNFTTSGEKILNNFTASGEVKKALDEKYQERMKIYGYIGMEVYDLYKQGKVSISQADMHFQKMEQVETEIARLEAEKQRIEMEKRKTNVCSCGYALSGREQFCPKCGKPVEKDEIICTCGKAVKKDMLFCPNCGKGVKEMNQGAVVGAQNGGQNAGMPGNPVPQPQYRECICGAKVPIGQNMCMECGRMIGN